MLVACLSVSDIWSLQESHRILVDENAVNQSTEAQHFIGMHGFQYIFSES